jgi:anti-sigma factor RsiW
MEKKLSRLTTEQRYELVAYVDGELDDAATARIEKLLAESSVARTEVESLIATYELLGTLPRPRASQDFTEKTMATARLEDVRPDVTQSPAYRSAQRGVKYAGWLVAMCAAGLLGYAATRFWAPRDYDGLVRDLDVVRQLDKFAEVGNIEFLDRLASDPGLMNELQGADAGAATPR